MQTRGTISELINAANQTGILQVINSDFDIIDKHNSQATAELKKICDATRLATGIHTVIFFQTNWNHVKTLINILNKNITTFCFDNIYFLNVRDLATALNTHNPSLKQLILIDFSAITFENLLKSLQTLASKKKPLTLDIDSNTIPQIPEVLAEYQAYARKFNMRLRFPALDKKDFYTQYVYHNYRPIQAPAGLSQASSSPLISQNPSTLTTPISSYSNDSYSTSSSSTSGISKQLKRKTSANSDPEKKIKNSATTNQSIGAEINNQISQIQYHTHSLSNSSVHQTSPAQDIRALTALLEHLMQMLQQQQARLDALEERTIKLEQKNSAGEKPSLPVNPIPFSPAVNPIPFSPFSVLPSPIMSSRPYLSPINPISPSPTSTPSSAFHQTVRSTTSHFNQYFPASQTQTQTSLITNPSLNYLKPG